MITLFVLLCVESISIYISSKILSKGINTIFSEVYDQGYKIKRPNSYKDTSEDTSTRHQNIKDYLLFTVPGVNIANAFRTIFKLHKVIHSEALKEQIVPMSIEEKEAYAKLSATLEKAEFFTCMFFQEQETVSEQKGEVSLPYPKLPPLAYTLDEVKQLNKVTNQFYRTGTTPISNIAIIGFPNSNEVISKVNIGKGSNCEQFSFQELSIEESNKTTFVVYPYLPEFNEEEQLKDCYESILQERHSKNTIGPTAIENTEEQQGPILKKVYSTTVRK